MAPNLQTLPQEIQQEIVKSLQATYSDFEVDKSVYSLAMTCRVFRDIADPFLYSRYSDDKRSPTNLAKFIRTLISRPDLWLNVKSLSIALLWRCNISMPYTRYCDMFADAHRLKTIMDPIAYTRKGLELQRHERVEKIAKLVGNWEHFIQIVTHPRKAFLRQIAHNPRIRPLYSSDFLALQTTILTLLSRGVQRLQFKRGGCVESVTIFRNILNDPHTISLKLTSLKELHYITSTSSKVGQLERVHQTKLDTEELDIFLQKMPTLKTLKVDGFAFDKSRLRWRDEPKSCGIESLALTYNFDVKYTAWIKFFGVFKGLKHFSYDGRFKNTVDWRLDGTVSPGFLSQFMKGIWSTSETLESLSLTGISRFKGDHAHLHYENGLPILPRLKFLKIQLDVLIGAQNEPSGFALTRLLPKSLEKLELWFQSKYESPDVDEQLLGLATSNAFPDLKEIKIVYSSYRYEREAPEEWKMGMKTAFGENGIDLVFVELPGKSVWFTEPAI